eukprot:Gb_03264 [translate_table: standard]
MWPRNADLAHKATPALRSLSFFVPPLPLNWIMAREYRAGACDDMAALAISDAPPPLFSIQ